MPGHLLQEEVSFHAMDPFQRVQAQTELLVKLPGVEDLRIPFKSCATV